MHPIAEGERLCLMGGGPTHGCSAVLLAGCTCEAVQWEWTQLCIVRFYNTAYLPHHETIFRTPSPLPLCALQRLIQYGSMHGCGGRIGMKTFSPCLLQPCPPYSPATLPIVLQPCPPYSYIHRTLSALRRLIANQPTSQKSAN